MLLILNFLRSERPGKEMVGLINNIKSRTKGDFQARKNAMVRVHDVTRLAAIANDYVTTL